MAQKIKVIPLLPGTAGIPGIPNQVLSEPGSWLFATSLYCFMGPFLVLSTFKNMFQRKWSLSLSIQDEKMEKVSSRCI